MQCGWRDSNPHGQGHRHLKPARLPIPPHPRGVGRLKQRGIRAMSDAVHLVEAGQPGLEPGTSGFGDRRYHQLSYWPGAQTLSVRSGSDASYALDMGRAGDRTRTGTKSLEGSCAAVTPRPRGAQMIGAARCPMPRHRARPTEAGAVCSTLSASGGCKGVEGGDQDQRGCDGGEIGASPDARSVWAV